MTQFTPVSALVGGALIGAAAVLLMAANGRIAGVSGIVEGMLAPVREWAGWKVAFLIGLIAAPALVGLFTGVLPEASYPHSLPMMIAGGLLVGFGTRLGSGCTSGHGVCGIARLSKRSLVATTTFMAAGIATVWVIRLASGG
ncbi:MAG: YeeE/YedE family protein [Amphiplicatus sp.]